MKKKTFLILLIVVLLYGGFIYLVINFIFPRTGSRSGRVIDAATEKPIQDAVVVYTWKFSGFFGPGELGAASYVTTTDKDGRYFIPNQRTDRHIIFAGALRPEGVLIYKDGYLAYQLYYAEPPVGRSFGYWDEEHQPYHEKNNLVKLYPWKEGLSHEEHVDWIRSFIIGGTALGVGRDLFWRELEEEKRRGREEALAKYKHD